MNVQCRKFTASLTHFAVQWVRRRIKYSDRLCWGLPGALSDVPWGLFRWVMEEIIGQAPISQLGRVASAVHLSACRMITLKVLNSIVLLGRSCLYVKEANMEEKLFQAPPAAGPGRTPSKGKFTVHPGRDLQKTNPQRVEVRHVSYGFSRDETPSPILQLWFHSHLVINIIN